MTAIKKHTYITEDQQFLDAINHKMLNKDTHLLFAVLLTEEHLDLMINDMTEEDFFCMTEAITKMKEKFKNVN